VRLTSTQVISNSSSFTFPLRLSFRTYLEGALQLPTPIMSTRVPYEPKWLEAATTLATRTDLYPTLVSGHTFPKIGKAVMITLLHQDPRLSAALYAAKQAKNLYMAYANSNRKRSNKNKSNFRSKQNKSQRGRSNRGRRGRGRQRGAQNQRQRGRGRGRSIANRDNFNLNWSNRPQHDLFVNNNPVRPQNSIDSWWEQYNS
jgi:hypothetical protein